MNSDCGIGCDEMQYATEDIDPEAHERRPHLPATSRDFRNPPALDFRHVRGLDGGMVNLSRIYTRLGDDGHTHLADMSRVPKTDSRVRAYADVDEANAAIGLAMAVGNPDPEIAEVLRAVQNDLFDVGADLSTPVVEEPEVPALRITQSYIDRLEAHCDTFLERLQPLRSFILPGGTPTAAYLHLGRTVIRRAERAAWEARAEYGEAMNPLAATYLNRASDLLFILARLANVDVGDVLWRPGGDHGPSDTTS